MTQSGRLPSALALDEHGKITPGCASVLQCPLTGTLRYMSAKSSRLTWKWEDGPEDAEGDDPKDVGPAWIDHADGSSERVNDGQWITRAEAQRLAAEKGYEVAMDD